MKALALPLLLALSACGADNRFAPSQVVLPSAPEEIHMKGAAAVAVTLLVAVGPAKGGEPEPCVMHIEQEGQLLHASYDSGECYPPEEDLEAWLPRWVQVDFQTTQLAMEVMNRPDAQPLGSNQGWYMRPKGPVGTFQIQVRSGYNDGRADWTVHYTRRGLAVSK